MTSVPPEQTPGAPMDGLAPPQSPQQAAEPLPVPVQPGPAPAPASAPYAEAQVRSMTKMIKLVGAAVYVVFIAWELLLISILPSATGQMQELQSTGSLISIVAIAAIVGVGWIAMMRISQSKVSIAQRQRTLMFAILFLLPGLVLAAATPLLINREPPLIIEIVSPAKATDLVAPVAVTVSVERSVATLKNLGYRPTKFQWDANGDGKTDDETVVPTFTSIFQKQGTYLVTAVIQFDGASPRRLQRRVTIPTAVFSVTPPEPIIEKTARFSIGHLLTDPKQLKQVTWDFGDASKTEVTKIPDVTHSFYATGEYVVTATIQMQTNVEQTVKRNVTVRDPVPLPFPVTLTAQPANLMGPAPFGALFSLQTEEPLREVIWDFGDGKEERGTDLLRTGHTFDAVGIYPVVAKVRSASGVLAELTQIVRVTENLNLSDLRFEGTPQVQSDKLQGELPLEVELTPKTTVPLVTFFWESADENTSVQGTTFRGTYRTEGTYTVTLVAQDADGRVLRRPLTIEVKPASAEPVINAQPENGVAPLTVQFDASETFLPPTETLAGFKWLYGDEERSDEAELGPARVTHTYREPGEYRVTLKVVTVSGKEFSAQRTVVARQPLLDACVTSSRTRVQPGKGVEFDSACSTGGPVSYVWDVRSNANPNVVLAQGPSAKYIYVFQKEGTYTVSLTLKDEWGNESSESVTITVAP